MTQGMLDYEWGDNPTYGNRTSPGEWERDYDLPVRPAGTWHRQAACRDSDEFHEAAGRMRAFGKYQTIPKVLFAICAACPVRTECLDEAIAEEATLPSGHRFGIRGGLSPTRRALMEIRR